MEPKPVISYFGETELLGAVLQKKLQTRLKQLQLDSSPRDEGPCFSSLCTGVSFIPLTEVSSSHLPPFARPALHTFWTSCADNSLYRSHDSPLIEQWLARCRGMDETVECLIVYVVTPEVRAKRSRLPAKPLEERIRADYRTKADDVITFRLSASDSARLVESYTLFTAKINSMCLHRFIRIIDNGRELVAQQRGKKVSPENFYNDVFIKKLDLAVCLEMTLQNESALQMYTEAVTDLESALSIFAATPPPWLQKMCHAPCSSWDYPKLVWSQLSWTYLSGVRDSSSPLLHLRTFFLSRLAHLLFVLGRAWSVSELVISTLHCMAREIKMLQLSFPAGAFNCWAYMTCNEAIQAFMALISPDSLESATSSLLLVRAELWHYALQKLQLIGELCGVMPSSNKLNHDKVLIKQITSGIHPVPTDAIPSVVPGIEDQGKKLIETLNNRQTFQTEFLRLGEMVIGAFKYAGRRRMAFKVGTIMAQFHRNLGLVLEAEELLSDICKFYSEDQWTQLSTNAFSLLADCQMKLKLEEKYVNTMLLLASLPPYPGASHDPTKWLNSLTRIAQKSPYQKLLNWKPLLELVSLSVVGDKQVFTVGDLVSVEMKVLYHGPQEISNLIAIIALRAGSTPLTPSTPSTPPIRTATPQGTSSPISLSNLDDLDLFNLGKLPGSRPIGGEGKLRTSSQVTHISSAEIAELVEEDGGRGKFPDMLRMMSVTLVPGENKIVASGEVKRPGDCFPNKLTLKWGCLDFVHTVINMDTSLLISIQPLRVNVDMVLRPEYGVFLEGFSHDCHMTVNVGPDTTVPENAQIRLDVGSGITCTHPEQLTFTLPSMSADQSHDCHMTLSVDGEDSHDSQAGLVSRTHEVMAYCEWLSPMHVAVLPLSVYRPLTVTVREHSAGEKAFLQLELLNSCPLPLSIREPSLSTELHLTALHTDPEVLYPGEDYSLIWSVSPGPAKLGSTTDAELHLKYLPCIHDNQPLDEHRPFSYSFKVSDMQPVFELHTYVDSQDQGPLSVNKPATVTFKLKNTSSQGSSLLPELLDYQVSTEKWTVEESVGQISVPGPGETIETTMQVCPSEAGLLPLPSLTLSVDGVTIGRSQVYDLSYSSSQLAAVQQSSSTTV